MKTWLLWMQYRGEPLEKLDLRNDENTVVWVRKWFQLHSRVDIKTFGFPPRMAARVLYVVLCVSTC